MATEINIAPESLDGKLKEFQRTNYYGGKYRVRMESEPSYVQALQVEGKESDIIVVQDKDSHDILATATLSQKNCFINASDRPTILGYLSTLKISEKYRSSMMLARGFNFISKFRKEKKSKLFLSVIGASNKKALNVLTSKRAGLPNYQDFGIIDAFLMRNSDIFGKVFNSFSPVKDINVCRASLDNIDEIIAFWKEDGKKYQFFPSYEREDFFFGGLLQGLELENIFIAKNSANRIVGTIGLWDQSSFRQRYVEKYPRKLKMILPFVNLLSRFNGTPSLPRENSLIRSSYLTGMCIKDNNPDVLKSILFKIFKEYPKMSTSDYLAVSVHRKDPLHFYFKQFPHKLFTNKLFLVYWDDDAKEASEVATDRVPYVELGSI